MADFAPQLNGREIMSIDVGPENEFLVFATTSTAKEEALRRYVQLAWASFAKSKVAPYHADVLRFAHYFQSEVRLKIEEAHPFVQPLPNGELLVVAAHCHNLDGNPELKAAVYKRKRLKNEGRCLPQAVGQPNEEWCLNFVHDALSGKRAFRTLNAFARQCLHIECDTSQRVVRALEHLRIRRGTPPRRLHNKVRVVIQASVLRFLQAVSS